jgi:flavin reductase ActVB
MPLDPQRFRATFSGFATSVAIVTAVDADDVPHGMTIGSLCPLSLAPPLLLFCIARSARAHAPLCAAERYCVSLLAQGQEPAARRFADPDADRFAPDLADYDGLPAIPDALGWLLCTRHALIDAGDHTIAIAQVEEARTQERLPLLYWRRGYRGLRAAA